MNVGIGSKSMLSSAAFLIIVFAGISAAQSIVVPFLLAVFVAIISHPLVAILQKIKIPQSVSVMIAVAVFMLTAAAIGQLIGGSLQSFSQNMPIYKEQMAIHMSQIKIFEDATAISKAKDGIMGAIEPGKAMDIGVSLLSNLGDMLGNAFLILLAAIFILLETNLFKEKVLLLSKENVGYASKVDSFIASVKRYMVIKTWVSVGTGVAVSISMWFLNVEYFILWGLLAFLLNYIPTIGSIIAAIPPICLAFIQLGSTTALIVALVCLVINIVFGNIIEPKFMGNGLGLSTTVVFVSLVFWGWLLGPVGMLLSVPLTMVVKIASDNSKNWHWLSVVLCDKAIQRLDDKAL